jgi:hypothetical protein
LAMHALSRDHGSPSCLAVGPSANSGLHD